MRRLLPVALSLTFAFCAYAIQSVQLPSRVLACSCVAPRPLAEMATRPDNMLVVATVGPVVGGGLDPTTVLTIERVFTGELPAQVLVQGIGEQSAACQLGARADERWVFGIYRSPEGRYSVSSCGINAQLGTQEGEALLAEAVGLFGEGQTPAAEPEQPAGPVDLAPWLGGLGWVLALIVVSGAVFGGIVLVASRRRSG